jgi:hypothetical protein
MNIHAQTSPPIEDFPRKWLCRRDSVLTNEKSWEESLQWKTASKATTQLRGHVDLHNIHETDSNVSTTRHEISEDLSEKAVKLFESGVRDLLDDSFGSNFLLGLTSLINLHSNDAIAVITPFVLGETVNAEVISETLTALGRIEHLPSYKFRRWLLESGLASSSPRIRDSATLGLASMRDPHAITYLQRAIQQEPSEELRQDMQSVLDYLERIRKCLLG